MEAAPFTLQVRLLKAEGMETLLYGCVTWTLGKEHFGELRTPQVSPTDHWLPAPTTNRRPHVVRQGPPEGTMRERRDDHARTVSPLCGGLHRANNERLTRRVVLGTMAGGENPRPGRPEKNWAQCLVGDLRVFRATEGSTEIIPLVFEAETSVTARGG